MNTSTLRELIKALGLSQEQAAHVLGVHPVTMRRWATGKINIPPPASRFLLFLLYEEIDPQDVMRALGDLH